MSIEIAPILEDEVGMHLQENNFRYFRFHDQRRQGQAKGFGQCSCACVFAVRPGRWVERQRPNRQVGRCAREMELAAMHAWLPGQYG